MIKAFKLKDIILEDDFFTSVTQKDVDFLNTFEPERLLYNFRKTAGLETKAAGPYSGWENTRIGGHTLGHYLAAAAQACASGYGECKGKDGLPLNERLSSIIKGLSECQKAGGTGFVFGATMEDPEKPELQFDKLEQGNQADTWVPWYTMHKILNGLVEVVKLCEGEAATKDFAASALEIAEKLGEWIYGRTSRWTEEERRRVLSVEYGAMNDCLYELYKCASSAGFKNSSHFCEAAHAFDEEDLFEAVLAGGENILNNKHANCTIPKFVGAINRCLTLGDAGSDSKKYLDYCRAFWDMVVKHHTYITGGNSECEHFGKDDILDAERSNCNCETCNTHNMLKLTRSLFMLTGEKKYADYYETTFINAILASVNHETGMTTYFQPMATGCFKTYCNPDVNKNYFWCCTGTGLENFTKLGDSFYFYDDDRVYVNQYVSSSVKWAEKNIILHQKSDLPMGEAVHFTIENKAGGDDENVFTLALRVPDWVCDKPTLLINDETVEAFTEERGYILLDRKWKNGDTVSILLPMEITVSTLPDNPDSAAFKFGPVVLAAELGRDPKMKLRQVGVQCDVCANKIIRGMELPLNGNYGGTSGLKPLKTEILHVKNSASVADFFADINNRFEREPATLRFELKDTDWPEPLIFSPYYLINNQRYGVYWLFDLEGGTAFESKNDSELDKYTIIEGIGVGYGAQTEGNASTAPYMQETGSGSVGEPHELTRYAKDGGSFSYLCKILPDKQNYLQCNFLREDNGKRIIIRAGETLIADYILSCDGSEEKFTCIFEIPSELTKGKTEVRIEFAAPRWSDSARLLAPLNTLFKA